MYSTIELHATGQGLPSCYYYNMNVTVTLGFISLVKPCLAGTIDADSSTVMAA